MHRKSRKSRREHAAGDFRFTTLESRLMMSANPLIGACACPMCTGQLTGAQASVPASTVIAAAAPAVTSSVASTIPALNSNPSATAKLFLDFRGDTNDHNTPAFTQDGDASTFNASEISAIRQIWQRVSEKYSPFNINVTTVDPGTYGDKQALRVLIGGNGAWNGANTTGSGGFSWIGSFYNQGSNTSYVFSTNLVNDPKYVAEAAAHEAGHGFGLFHQSTSGAEYNPGDSARAPVMGSSYFSQRGLWWNGSSQDDLSILSGSNNGFGYRADDHGNSISTASGLSFTGVNFSSAGVIAKSTDADYFSFSTTGGASTFSLSVAQYGAMLDAKLQILSSSGAAIATADTATLGESLSLNLSAGNYFVVVSSKGGYGDIGQYTLTGTAPQGTVATTVAAPSNLSATAASSTRVNLSWADNSSNETGFVVERSTNGSTYTAITTTAAGATSYADTTVSGGTTYAYRVKAINGSTNSSYSATQSVATPAVVTVPAAPSNLTTAANSSTSVSLNWTDNASNETGFKIERATGSGSFVTLTNVSAGVKNYTDTSAVAGTTYRYRVSAYNSAGSSAAVTSSNVTTPAVVNTPAAPTGVAATAMAKGKIRLTWNAPTGTVKGYAIERSTDGSNWTQVATLKAGATGCTNSGLSRGTTYYFRVRAFNDNGWSAFGNLASASTAGPGVKSNAAQANPPASASTPTSASNDLTSPAELSDTKLTSSNTATEIVTTSGKHEKPQAKAASSATFASKPIHSAARIRAWTFDTNSKTSDDRDP